MEKSKFSPVSWTGLLTNWHLLDPDIIPISSLFYSKPPREGGKSQWQIAQRKVILFEFDKCDQQLFALPVRVWGSSEEMNARQVGLLR